MDEETLNEAAAVYSLIVEAGVYRAPNIKTAEAAKLTENAQRDINIAFMNELAVVFDLVGIETNEVVKAMRTKWNALNFTPGLVGGHCIGIDPYYFIYHAETLGYSSEIIAAGRRVNDRMGKFVADTLIKQLIRLDKNVRRAKICLMGITFKEDCPDTRNSKAAEVEMRLSEYGIRAEIIDPVVDKEDAKRAFGLDVSNELTIKDADCLVFLVAHKEFKNLTVNDLKAMCNMEAKPLIVDVKSIFSKDALEDAGFAYWSL
jgi:UDP-N-acetyl-D-galactosamine dehydrogenase